MEVISQHDARKARNAERIANRERTRQKDMHERGKQGAKAYYRYLKVKHFSGNLKETELVCQMNESFKCTGCAQCSRHNAIFGDNKYEER